MGRRKLVVPQEDYSHNCETEDEESDVPEQQEDPTLSGGLPNESGEGLDRQSVRTDSGCEQPEGEEAQEGEEEQEDDEEDSDKDSSACDSSDDDDDDFSKGKARGDGGTPRSSCSRSSPGTVPGTRQRRTWILCLEIHKANRATDSIHREICNFLEQDLAKAEFRISENSGDKKYWGGWCHKEVSLVSCSFHILLCVFTFLLFDPQTYETRQGAVVNSILQCPMNFRARCPNLMRVQHTSKVVTVWRSGFHRITSHDDDRSVFLKMKQKDGVKDAVRISPLSSGLTVRRSLKNLSPKKHVAPEFKKHVQRLVSKEKVKLLSQELHGVSMDGSFGSIADIARKKWFVTLIKDHNDEVFAGQVGCGHLKPTTAMVIGKEIDELKNVIHLNLSTQYMLHHMIRGINARWAMTISGDGLYCLCRHQFGMVSFCIVGLHGEIFPLCYSIVSKESISGYRQTWRGLVAASFYLIKRAKVCDSRFCQFCREVRAYRSHKRFHEFTRTPMIPIICPNLFAPKSARKISRRCPPIPPTVGTYLYIYVRT